MMFKIAWRNLWRNKRRSLIVQISIIVGVVVLILIDSLSMGFIKQMVDLQVTTQISHIQIHKLGFNDDKVIKNYMPNPDTIEDVLKKSSFVKAFSKKVIMFGLVNSANSSTGAIIAGVEPNMEQHVTIIKKSIIKGKYLTGQKHQIVIGDKMAEKLEVGLDDKIVLMTNSLDGTASSELFRVIGIFSTGTSEFDKSEVFISLGEAQSMAVIGSNVNEFAVITDNPDKTQIYKTELLKSIDKNKYEVLTFQELAPLFVSLLDSYKSMIYIVYAIIATAALFGIINTMLMSVFERIQEIGVLMAIGMKNMKIFKMIIYEALLLGFVGSVVGIVVGLALYYPLSENGLNLGIFAQGLGSMGMSAIVYPQLSIGLLINSLLIMPLTAVVGAIYPAIKALRLQATEAMRYV